MISGSTSWGSASPSSQPILGNCEVKLISLSFFSILYSSCQNTVWWPLYQVWRLHIIKRATYYARGADIYENSFMLDWLFLLQRSRSATWRPRHTGTMPSIVSRWRSRGWGTWLPKSDSLPKIVFFLFSKRNIILRTKNYFPGSSLIESWSTSEKSERVEYKVRIDKERQWKIDHFNFNVQRS